MAGSGHNPHSRMDPWRTSIVDAGPEHIRVKGYDVLDLGADRRVGPNRKE